ncbi:MAG: hypothetical protein IJV85_06280 [Clostridia bacterium]|nr:hypothetical protein [Clostridia bacterium]MBQ9729180.1 hypothetical protein [Clostridia bacterium]
MDIASIDKNFALQGIEGDDIEWFDILEKPFSIHGVLYDEQEELFLRLPRKTAQAVSRGVNILCPMTTGGRVRFTTDSPFVAIKCIAPFYCGALSHMPILGTHGFSVYVNGVFDGKFAPENFENAKDGVFAFEEKRTFMTAKEGEENLCELFFPLYGGVKKLYVGLKKGSVLKEPKPYSVTTPVVFYGSSITQGCCASRPGNDYISYLSRWLDCDYVNLGFSGNGKAEPIMIDYLNSLPASVYVLDYDYNAESLEELREHHLPMYERIRSVHKDVPLLFISKPDLEYDPETYARRDIILETYNIAKERGDQNVAFIDGTTLYGDKDRDACAVDTCHPNDLGFYRMAEGIYPVLKKLLKK